MDEETALPMASDATPDLQQQLGVIQKEEAIPVAKRADSHKIREDIRDQSAIAESSSMQKPPALTSDTKPVDLAAERLMNGQIRTLNGNIAEDEYSADAMNHEILLAKIDSLLERLKLDA
jgi:ankyrin repeat/BTB/POZ domain-containing protein 1